jgi:hypothetical protein
LPSEGLEFRVVGLATDIHFLVLSFNNALGTPIMCALILKYHFDISEIPISWSLGIEIQKDIRTQNNNYETFDFFMEKVSQWGRSNLYLPWKSNTLFYGLHPKSLHNFRDVNCYARDNG